jgi:hypothetical protein
MYYLPQVSAYTLAVFFNLYAATLSTGYSVYENASKSVNLDPSVLGLLIPDDGGSTHLWNVGRQSFYTAE